VPLHESIVKKPNWRRVLLWVGMLAGALGALEVEEEFTSRRKVQAFMARLSPISAGMTETQVRRAAGAPDEFVPELSKAEEPTRLESCASANGTAAMMYSLYTGGWLQSKFEVPSGIMTHVVCLDTERRVVKTYLEMVKF
jgi:hypothetical protein